MSLKQVFNRIVKALFGKIERYRVKTHYEYACSYGHCPTSKEIENDSVKSLAKRLKAGSHKKTLTNILEWQERNLSFWHERHNISSVCIYSLVGAVIVFIIGLVISFSFFMLSVQALAEQIFFWAILISVGLLGASSGSAFIIGWMIRSNRKISLWKGLEGVFARSVSLDFFLENKLGICRDYAKLTTCLLKNIYPSAEICLAFAPNHVATGIKVDNELYMLDQRLPLLTFDKWKDYRHQRKRDKVERLKKECLKKVDISAFLSKETIPLDTKKIASAMEGILKIDKKPVNRLNPPLKIPWKKGAIMYEDNEFVNYSLAKRLEIRILTELVDINRVTRIDVERTEKGHQRENLIFVVHFT